MKKETQEMPKRMERPVESHPFEPYVPEKPRILIMGTFPPQPHRWAMEFYYPNPTNDFWRVMGLIFMGDKDALYDPSSRTFRLEQIKQLLNREGIAMYDTGRQIRRLAGNASDKFLEIVSPVDLEGMLLAHPTIDSVATTGQKAAEVVALQTATAVPKAGESVKTHFAGRDITVWRMPSTSRAYPLPVEKKAQAYARIFGKD